MGYGFWFKGLKPSDFVPDFELCTQEEFARWNRDREKEKKGETDFEYGWGIGMYND